MRRTFRQAALLLTLALLVAFFGSDSLLPSWHRFREWNRLRSATDAARSHTYVLRESSPLNFAIPAGSERIRVLVTLNLMDREQAPPFKVHRTGWTQTLRYEIRSRGGQLLREASHTCRSSRTVYRTADGEFTVGTFYFGTSNIPLASQEFRISLRGLPHEAASITFYAADADRGVADVGLRISSWQPEINFDRPGEWQRLSPRRRDFLARASIRPQQLLTHHEQLNLLHWVWKPLAPTGMEGRDYERRTLFRMPLDGLTEVDDEPVDAGLYTSPNRAVNVPLPQGNGFVRIQSSLADSAPWTEGTTPDWTLTTSWYRDRDAAPVSTTFSSSMSQMQRDLPLAGGLLSLRASQAARMRLFWVSTDNDTVALPVDITPERRISIAYPALAPSRLRYSIGHAGNQPTPIRITARTICPNVPKEAVSTDAEARFHWQASDTTGVVIASGECGERVPLSEYDMLRSSQAAVSEPSRYYFRMPANVDHLDLATDSPHVVLQVESSLPGHPRVTAMDASFDETETDNIRNWYTVRPDDEAVQRRYHLPQDVVVQSRPPAPPNPDILAGNYRWDDFRPVEETAGRFVLMPRATAMPIRPEAAHVVFIPWTDVPGDPNKPRLLAHRSLTPLEPITDRIPDATQETRWIYIAHLPHRAPISAAERPVVQWSHGFQGELRLSRSELPHDFDIRPRQIETHELFVSAGSLREVPEDARQYLKRFAYRFDRALLTFEIDKLTDGEETITLQYLRPITALAGMQLHVAVDAVPKSPYYAGRQLTFLQHRCYFPPPAPEHQRGYVLNTNSEEVFGTGSCMIPLGDDLPAGRYRLTVTKNTDEVGHILAYRLLPGSFDKDAIETGPRSTQ